MVLYTRVSTDEQATQGYGLDAQRAELERAAEYRRWQVAFVVRDEGASGKSLDRPGLRVALEAIARGEADGIAVAKLDRLTRSIIDFSEVLQWLEAAEADLAALDVSVDTGTPGGRMISRIVVVIAEWEREVIADRTRAGLAAKRARGESIGRPAVVDQPDLAARIATLRGEGLTLQAICDELNADRVPTPRGAAKWARSSVQSAAGYTRPRPRRLPPELPPLPRRRKPTR